MNLTPTVVDDLVIPFLRAIVDDLPPPPGLTMNADGSVVPTGGSWADGSTATTIREDDGALSLTATCEVSGHASAPTVMTLTISSTGK